MEQQILLAADFLNRADLEDYIKAEVGINIIANQEAGSLIRGTKEELKKLQLSDQTNVFGIRCLITDFSTKQKLEGKIRKK
ncbi:MAG TPA: hypothetical protein ENH85_05460 [Candidatus Scalindua sp.]|nr:hypothetical protein [Candidatus Scalindua sp.]